MKEQTKEGNRKIARFDGFQIIWGNPSHQCDRHHYLLADECCSCAEKYDRFTKDGEQLFCDEGLQYHTSWDWLMPAWGTFRQRVWDNMNGYPQEFEQWKQAFLRDVFNENIKGAFLNLIAGIEWYNKEQEAQASDATDAKSSNKS